MKSFFARYVIRQTREQLASWSSLQKTVYLLLPLLVYYVVNDAAELALWALIDRISERFLAWASLYGTTINAGIYAVSAVLILLCLRTVAHNEITYATENEILVKSGFSEYLSLLILGFSSALALNLTANLTGFVKLSPNYRELYETQLGIHAVIGLLIYGFLSPFVEEVLFRGIIYNRMRRMFPVWMSIPVSAVLFGVFHANLVQGVYGFLMGLLMAYLYEMSRSFLYPLLIHTVANLTVYTVMAQPGFTGLSKITLVIITIVMFLLASLEILLLRRHFRNKEI